MLNIKWNQIKIINHVKLELLKKPTTLRVKKKWNINSSKFRR